MKALWIRVEAHEVDSVRIGRFAEALGVDVVTALGHYVALGGAVAEHTDSGYIDDVPDRILARWGRWSGKAERFAQAVRLIFQADDGEYANWREEMGELVKRRARDRVRKSSGTSAETPGKFQGKSTELPRKFPAIPALRNGTERNGSSERSISGAGNTSTDAVAPASAPPADASVDVTATAFVECFYATASAKRRADVMADATLSPAGARVGRHESQSGIQRVRAGSPGRLVAKMRETMRERDGLKDRDKAIVVLLRKLGDTSDGSAPGVAAAAAVEREERTSAAEITAARAWYDDQPNAVIAAIEADLYARGLRTDDVYSAHVRDMAHTALVVQAWREATAPHAPPGQ